MCVITPIRRNYGFEKQAHAEHGSTALDLGNDSFCGMSKNRMTRRTNPEQNYNKCKPHMTSVFELEPSLYWFWLFESIWTAF